jgi:hypothetical protein
MLEDFKKYENVIHVCVCIYISPALVLCTSFVLEKGVVNKKDVNKNRISIRNEGLG